jgi:hypothetical protein
VGSGGPLLLETSHNRKDALYAFQYAIGKTNDDFVELEKDELWARINAPVPTPDGPMALVTECEPSRALTLMLEKLARGLEEAGVSGKLRPGKQFIDYHFENNAFPALNALVTLPVDQAALLASYDPYIKRPDRVEWLVERDITRQVVDRVMEWVLDIEGPVQVWVGATRFQMDAESVADFVVDTLPSQYMLSVARSTGHDRRRAAQFSEYGCLSVASYDVNLSRAQHLSELIGVMRSIAPQSNTAFVREASSSATERTLLRILPPISALVEAVGGSLWTLPHLERDYVYDAYVAQVLTQSQLAKTSDLPPTRWSIEDLGADRHLVVHRAPDLWFENDPTPYGDRVGPRISPVSDEVLAQARADFGDAIMTSRTLEEHPPDLPHDELVRALAPFNLTP